MPERRTPTRRSGATATAPTNAASASSGSAIPAIRSLSATASVSPANSSRRMVSTRALRSRGISLASFGDTDCSP